MWSIYGDPDYDSHVAPDRPIAYTNPHHIAWSMPTLMTARVKSGPSPGSIGEVGRVTVSQADGGQWHPVGFSRKYKNPVVVMGALSTHGGDPSTLRVKDVTATGFKFQIDEWDYLTPPGSHKPETVAWMVMEAGRHALPDGKVIEAGRTSTDGNWKKVSFSSSFGTAPVVFSQISTRNGGDAATTRQKDVHPGGFTVAVQEEEANGTTSKVNGPHWPETVSWVAISRGSATAGKRRFQAAKTKIDSTTSQMVFTQSFSTAPALFAQMQTFNGWNPATTRYRSLSTGGAKVFIQEERSSDDELNHVIEGVGWLAIEPGTISAK
jgi:hypothetical protein